MKRSRGKPEWTEAYNCHRLSLGFGMSVNVNWPLTNADGKFEVSFNGVDSCNRSTSIEESKKDGLRLAIKCLTGALDAARRADKGE